MKKLSNNVLAVGHSPIRKFAKYADAAEEKGNKVYYLNIGQPDIETPKVFMEAVKNFNKDIIAYAPSPGMPVLIDALISYYDRIGLKYNKEDIVITTGASESLFMVMNAICNQDDEVILAEPYYTGYNFFTKLNGANIVPIMTKAEDGYQYAQIDKIKPLINLRTKAIIISNPGNPTGTLLSHEEIQAILELAAAEDIFVVADEVYREFTYDGLKTPSFGEFDDFSERIVLVDSVSKRYSACGARIGSIASKNKVLMDNIMKIAQSRLSVSTLDQVGAAALYNLPLSYFDEVRKEYQNRRDVTYEELSKIDGIICEKPKGAFYIMAKLPIDDAEDFLIYTLEKFSDKDETVMFTPAEGFYKTEALGKNEIRIACMLNSEDMRRGVELIRMSLEEYQKR